MLLSFLRYSLSFPVHLNRGYHRQNQFVYPSADLLCQELCQERYLTKSLRPAHRLDLVEMCRLWLQERTIGYPRTFQNGAIVREKPVPVLWSQQSLPAASLQSPPV